MVRNKRQSVAKKRKKYIQAKLFNKSLPKVKDFFCKLSEDTTSTTTITNEDSLEDKVG